MKKKIFAAILASAMLLSVAGCTQDNGGNEDGNQTETNGSAADTTTSSAEVNNGGEVDNKTPHQVDTGYKLADDEGKVLNIHCWNEDFKNYFEAYYKLPDGVTVNWIVNTNDGGVYQQKLDEALFAQGDVGADDKVDISLRKRITLRNMRAPTSLQRLPTPLPRIFILILSTPLQM